MQTPRVLDRSISWRMNRFYLLNEDFVKLLEDQTDLYLEINDNNNIDPRILWDAYKAYMRGIIISFSSQKKKERLAEQTNIENRIKQLEEEYTQSKSQEVLEKLKKDRSLLNDIITKKAEKDILFAKQRLFEFGNKSNKFLARLANNSPSNSFISAIKDENGCRHMDSKNINESFKKFYEKLYKSEVNYDTIHNNRFLNDLIIPQLTTEQANSLEEPITIIEIEKAISSLQSGKCPGADGYPIEFF